MRLGDLISGIEVPASGDSAGPSQLQIVGDSSVEVSDLAYDSRKAGPGTLFFCVPGEKVDGHSFAREVVEAGAVGLVVERELEVGVPQVVVPDARAAMAPLAARFWGDPTAELRVVGVTGTNGKTTTAFLVREILEAAGIRCGLLGTVKQVVGGVEEEVVRTTPEAIDLQATFRRMVEAGDEACAMEVSSHALALHRCDEIHFEVALFTNLTQDHLDFHSDMEAYFESKRMLFEMSPGTSIVNLDDPYGARLAAKFECVTFSTEGREAELAATDITLGPDGAQFTVLADRRTGPVAAGDPPCPAVAKASSGMGPPTAPPARVSAAEKAVVVRTRLQGRFNVANAVGALVAATALGVALDDAARGLSSAAPPPGRFEPVDEGQRFSVLVDYAHTPDSLANVLRAAREMTEGKVVVVFGAGGDRDRGKRPKMGRVAAELADLAVVTSDNPRSEDPGAILAEIRAGMDGGAEVAVEPDRRAAIALALRRAEPGDVVVIAGKGHEQGQEFEAGRRVPFDDRVVAREELRKLGSSA